MYALCGYSRLYGSYAAISSGLVRDALVDFTGGMSETFNLRNEDKLPPDLWDLIRTSHAMGSMIGGAIWVRETLPYSPRRDT